MSKFSFILSTFISVSYASVSSHTLSLLECDDISKHVT